MVKKLITALKAFIHTSLTVLKAFIQPSLNPSTLFQAQIKAATKAAIAAMDTAYKAADNALKAEIDAIQAIPLEGDTNSIESLFKTVQA